MPFDSAEFKTNTVADVLRRAKQLIDSPEKWIKGAAASRANGKRVSGFDGSPLPKDCIAFCALGAIWFAEGGYGPAREVALKSGISASFNDDDERTHADVIRAFDRAIALAEGRAP